MNTDAGLGNWEDKLCAMKEADSVVFAWESKTQESFFD